MDDLTGLAGITTVDRIVIGTLLTIATSVAAFIGKQLIPIARELLSCQKITAEAIQQFSNSQAVLVYLLQSYIIRFSKTKSTILIIEDSIVDAAIIGDVCRKLARKYGYKLLDVPNLTHSYIHVPDAKLIILDVCLPDASLAMIQEYVKFCPCSVVIHSGEAYTKKDFPTAAAIILKGDTALLTRELEALLTDSRGEG